MRPEPFSCEIRTAYDTQAPGCDLVRQWLREHNWTVNAIYMEALQQEANEAQPLVLLAQGDSGVVGGLFAETVLSWLRISIMSVHPEWRFRGIGAKLVAAAEQQAVIRGCRQAYVDTMEYQAPQFYRAHGYQQVGELKDWDSHGHSKLFFTKQLQQS